MGRRAGAAQWVPSATAVGTHRPLLAAPIRCEWWRGTRRTWRERSAALPAGTDTFRPPASLCSGPCPPCEHRLRPAHRRRCCLAYPTARSLEGHPRIGGGRPRVRSSDIRTSAASACAFARATRARRGSAERASGTRTMPARRAWAAAKGRRRAERIGPCWQRSGPRSLRPSRPTSPLTADWRCQQGPMRSDCRRARDPLRGPCPPAQAPSPAPDRAPSSAHACARPGHAHARGPGNAGSSPANRRPHSMQKVL